MIHEVSERPITFQPDSTSARPEELMMLQHILEAPNFLVFYLWGPRGTGKTYAAQELCDRVRGYDYRVVHTTGQQIHQPEDIFCSVADELGKMTDRPKSFYQFLTLFDSEAQNRPLLWVLDDLDPRWSAEEWFRTIVLAVARRHVPILLLGTDPPAHMWPGQQYFQAQLRPVWLTELTMDGSERMLRQNGVTDPLTLQIALQICQGIPSMLMAIADALSLFQHMSPPPDLPVGERELELASFMVEHLCHPGSRRLRWRAGQGRVGSDSSDSLLAAASLIPSFNQELITHMVGRELVRTHWDRFTQLPFILHYRGGYYAISPMLRLYINETVQRARPSAWERWANTATQFYLQQLHAGRLDKAQTWGLLGGLARTRVATTPFLREPSHCQWEFAWEPPTRSNPHGRAVIGNAQGVEAQAYCRLDSNGTLHIETVPQPGQSMIAMARLVHGLAQQFSQFREVHWTGDLEPALVELLHLLGFENDASNGRRLRVPPEDFEIWLQAVLASPRGVVPEDPVKALKAVQAVLQAIRDGEEEDREPAVQTFWASVGGPVSFRTWFLDAINSVEDRRPGEKTLLKLYYVERQGTHEELAEMLHISRATYFRNLRSELEALASVVFV